MIREAGLLATQSPVKPEDVDRGCPESVIGAPGSARNWGNPKIQDQERGRMDAAGKPEAASLARPKD